MRPPAVAYFLFGLVHLALRPALHGLLAQTAHLLDQPILRIVSPLEIPLGVLHHRQQLSHLALDLRMSLQPTKNFFITELGRFHRIAPFR